MIVGILERELINMDLKEYLENQLEKATILRDNSCNEYELTFYRIQQVIYTDLLDLVEKGYLK